MPRRVPPRFNNRAVPVRVNGDMLVEGGWLGMPAAFNDDGRKEPPTWWLANDNDRVGGAFYPIGPNGPGTGPGPYATQPPANGGWWNTPRPEAGLLPQITRALGLIVGPIVRTAWSLDGPSGPQALPLWVRDPMLSGGPAPGGTAPVWPSGWRLEPQGFYATVLTHALLWGRSPVICQEGAAFNPLPGSFRHLNPFMVAADDSGHWVIDPHGDDPIRTDADGRFTVGGTPWRLIVFRGLPPNDGHTPEGILLRHWDTFRIGAAVSKSIENNFRTGVPAGFLKVSTPNMTAEQAQTLKDSWMAAHGGSKRSIAVLNATTDFQPISWTAEQQQTAEISRVTLRDVAHAFGLSSGLLDVSDGSLTYSNISERRRDMVDGTLSSIAASFLNTLSQLLPSQQRLRVVWSDYYQPEITALIGPLNEAITSGLMTLPEARALLGLAPLDALEPPANPQPEPAEGGDDEPST